MNNRSLKEKLNRGNITELATKKWFEQRSPSNEEKKTGT